MIKQRNANRMVIILTLNCISRIIGVNANT